MTTEISPQIIRPGVDLATYLPQLINNFYSSWTEQASLSLDHPVATAKIVSYLPNTYVLIDSNHPETVLSQVHTVPTEIIHSGQEGLLEFLRIFPNYQQVENQANNPAHAGINTVICFSVNGSDNRQKINDTPKPIYLIKNLPFPADIRKIAYSFMSRPEPDFLLANLNDPRNLGPIGLHLSWGKAIPFAILSGSRPEHIAAQGSNTLAAYPRNSVETVDFQDIISRWKKLGKIPVTTMDFGPVRATLFTDLVDRIF